ncbi:MAG: RDD family protein [Planctomycetota bacterium]|nr:RDD family protein [Planctomycetota bacterium]
MSFDQNPYASFSPAGPVLEPKNLRTADLGKRFLGALVDGLIGIVFVGPGYGLMIAGSAMSEQPDQPGPLFFVGLAFILLGGIALLGTQIYLAATRGQTIGKYFLKTQIVDFETGVRANFVQCFLLRSVVNALIGAVPCVGGIYSLVDICFVFREDRRCIHDLLAKTCVIDIS